MLQDDANKAEPRQAFFYKAKELYRFVRPATPTYDLTDKIKKINMAWVLEILSTLMTHGRTQLDFLSGSLKAWNLSATDCAQEKLNAKKCLNHCFLQSIETPNFVRIRPQSPTNSCPTQINPTPTIGPTPSNAWQSDPVNVVGEQHVPSDQPSASVNRLRPSDAYMRQ